MEYVIAVGLIGVVFGTLLLFAPNSILSLERRANRIYMTDPTLMQYSVRFVLGLFLAALFMMY